MATPDFNRAIERLQDAIERSRLENATLTKELNGKIDNLEARFRDFIRESDKHIQDAKVSGMAAKQSIDLHEEKHKEHRKFWLLIGGSALAYVAEKIISFFTKNMGGHP